MQVRQAELAKKYGIYGFCYHYYWFAGRKLLERPITQMLSNPQVDIPFCICWANENWTRRWDGAEDDVLLAQVHCARTDLDFIEEVIALFQDPRYIHVDGHPLLIVYRVNLLPEPSETALRWRDRCRELGLPEPYLVAAQTFGIKDPRPFGFDAAVEFPPHNLNPHEITNDVTLYNKEFSGRVFCYDSVVDRAVTSTEPYPHFRCVFPGWDNEARKPGKGHVYLGATPRLYGQWLDKVCRETAARPNAAERLVFVNAWNEWAEGAHLEPDRRFGYAYLRATGETLNKFRGTKEARNTAGRDEHHAPHPTVSSDQRSTGTETLQIRRKIVVVSHDAHPMGAQYLALNIARELAESFGCEVHMIVLGAGSLQSEFAKFATVHSLAGQAPNGAVAVALANNLHTDGVDDAIVNTTASGGFVETLSNAGISLISLVHELPQLIERYGLQPQVAAIAHYAEKVVFPAERVRNGFVQFAELPSEKTVIRPQGLYKKNKIRGEDEIQAARAQLRQRLELTADTEIIIGVGYGDHRKGLDLFVDIGVELMSPPRGNISQ